jgi:hypothetical protein
VNRHRLRLLIPLALVLLNGCNRTVPLTVPNDTPVQVSFLGENTTYTLTPRSEEYHQLDLWIKRNQSGWSLYVATTPGRGILVTGRGLWLQFIDSSAIARIPEGTFTKSVVPSDYAFLRR